MKSLMQALKNKITGTTVVDNAANPLSAYSQNQRKMKVTRPQAQATSAPRAPKVSGVGIR